MRRRPAAAPAHLALAAAALLAAAELSHALASRRRAPRPRPERSCVLIVLGCPSRPDGSPSAMQRWRVAIAVRTLHRLRDGRLLLTGAARAGGASEAETMASVAASLGVADELIEIEDQSRSTWENIMFALEQLERSGAELEQLCVVSDPVHALRGRRYVARQRPDLAQRLVGAEDHRLGEHPVLKVISVAYELERMLWNRRRWITDGLPMGR